MTPMTDEQALAVLDGAARWCIGKSPVGSDLNLRQARAHLAARIAGLEADNERLRSAFSDEDERASVHWYGRWVEDKRRADRAEAELARCRDAVAAVVREMDKDEKGKPYVYTKPSMVIWTEKWRGWVARLNAATDSARGVG